MKRTGHLSKKAEQTLTQTVIEVRSKRSRKYLDSHLLSLGSKWEIGRGGVIGFVANYLENPRRWLNSNPKKTVKGRNTTLGDMMCTRMYDYMELLGYQQEEISSFFKLARRVNRNYKMPERQNGQGIDSLDCYEGRSERPWLLDKFKGELG